MTALIAGMISAKGGMKSAKAEMDPDNYGTILLMEEMAALMEETIPSNDGMKSAKVEMISSMEEIIPQMEEMIPETAPALSCKWNI